MVKHAFLALVNPISVFLTFFVVGIANQNSQLEGKIPPESEKILLFQMLHW